MTNYQAATRNAPRRGYNKKDSASERYSLIVLQPVGFWGLAGFMPTAPGEWVYAWPEVEGCPKFEVIEAGSCIIASLKDVVRVFIDIPHGDIKDYLDDLILAIYRHDADIDAEIEWREPGDEETPPAWMGGATC